MSNNVIDGILKLLGNSGIDSEESSHITDMVWLYRSPISGEEGGLLLVHMKNICLRGA